LIALLGSSPRWLLTYPIAAAAGLLATTRLSPAVERGHELAEEQLFIAYLFVRKYDASPQTLAILFFAIGILQALSFQAAVRLVGRFGLLRTMVFTHLPSNLFLIAVAFAPNLAGAITLLLARYALSQMDVPTRQAYVMGVVDPSERTAAAAYTNTARYATRPVAPLAAGATGNDIRNRHPCLFGHRGAPLIDSCMNRRVWSPRWPEPCSGPYAGAVTPLLPT